MPECPPHSYPIDIESAHIILVPVPGHQIIAFAVVLSAPFRPHFDV